MCTWEIAKFNCVRCWCVTERLLYLQGQTKLVDHLRRSYSTSDLSNDGAHLVQRHRPVDEEDEDELGMHSIMAGQSERRRECTFTHCMQQ